MFAIYLPFAQLLVTEEDDAFNPVLATWPTREAARQAVAECPQWEDAIVVEVPRIRPA